LSAAKKLFFITPGTLNVHIYLSNVFTEKPTRFVIGLASLEQDQAKQLPDYVKISADAWRIRA
jgi:hypothetical protein